MAENRSSDGFSTLTIDETLKQLQTNPVTGLTATEAKQRIDNYGRNEVAEKRQNPLVGFLKRFWGLTAWMLEIAIVLSFVLGKYLDLYVITALLLVNAILGFAQEQQATRAVKALKQKLHLQTRVLRDRTWSAITAPELVRGEIIAERAGDV